MKRMIILIAIVANVLLSQDIWKGKEFLISVPYMPEAIINDSEIEIIISHEPNTIVNLNNLNGTDINFSTGNKYQTIYNLKINQITKIIKNSDFNVNNLITFFGVFNGNYSFRLVSENVVSVWVNIKISNKEESYNLMPINRLGNEYKIVTENAISSNNKTYPDYFYITASEDRTTIEIEYPDFGIENVQVEVKGGQKTLEPGEVFNFRLNKTETFGVNNFYANQSLTGTKIRSDKPISVISGNWPTSEISSNMLVESMISTENSGNNFHLIPFSDEEFKVKIVSYEPETEVKIDDEETFILDGSSLIQDESSYEFNVSSNKTITSNKPIMVIQYPKSPSVSMVAMNPIEKYSESFTSLSNGKTKYLVAPINENSEIIENVSIKKEIVDGNEIELEFVSEFEEVNSENLKYKKYGLFKINQNENFEITGESISLYVGDENGIFAEQAYTKLEQITSSVKSQNQFPLFPNPANNEIYISDYVGNAKIINALGIEVWNGNVDNSHKIDISNLPIGYYQLILDNNTSKFIKY